jgi:hypothetical protein
MPDTPDWWQTLLLAAAAYRTWRLLAEDDIFDWPRRRLLRLGDWREEGDPVPGDYRRRFGEFVACPWCLGFWVAAAWWVAWLATDDWTAMLATPFAISAAVGVTRGRLDPPD